MEVSKTSKEHVYTPKTIFWHILVVWGTILMSIEKSWKFKKIRFLPKFRFFYKWFIVGKYIKYDRKMGLGTPKKHFPHFFDVYTCSGDISGKSKFSWFFDFFKCGFHTFWPKYYRLGAKRHKKMKKCILWYYGSLISKMARLIGPQS